MNKLSQTRFTRRSAISSALSALAVPVLTGAEDRSRPITLGQVSLSFYAVTGAVTQLVLERLGHNVTVKEAPHELMFPMLSDGTLDIMAAVWLPEGHAEYWSRYGRHALEVAKLYQGARFFWAVPDYVPEAEVSSISDLSKPEVMARMTRLIRGIGDGAMISKLSRKAISVYGLSGYAFSPGTQQVWMETLKTAIQNGDWVIFPTWAPQFLNRDGRLRQLTDPRGILGGLNHASLVAPAARWSALPERTRAAIGRISLSIDAVTEMDWLVNARNMTPRRAAELWMADNQGSLATWLSPS